MNTDRLTVLTAVDGARATKVITRSEDGWQIEPYGRADLFSVRQIEVADIFALGDALRSLETASNSFVIRGEPLPGTDLDRCRRLLYARVLESGEIVEPTFKPAARRVLPVDFDSLPTPQWDPDKLARRREAILRDMAEHGEPPGDPDLDPAPIDPVHDWPLVVRAAIATLPSEFAHVHAWWQLTSSAGIKPGVWLRLWFMLAEPLTDEQAKIWLKNSPVDLSIYRPVQPIYTAAPIFDPPELDPVPERSGYWFRFHRTVTVPEIRLPEPEPIRERKPTPLAADLSHEQMRARRYADACLRSAEQAAVGDRHPSLRSAAITCFGLAEHGLVDYGEIMGDLFAITSRLRWGEKRANDLIAWCAAFAAANRPLPEAFRK